MICCPSNRIALACILWLSAAFQVLAAPPSLTRLVPADAGVCLTAEGVATHIDRFQEGPLYARWQQFPPLAQWTRDNGPALKRIANDVGHQLGVDVQDVWRRVFGHQTVLAIWPPQDADQKHGPGLLLVEAAEPALLATLVAGVRDVQERSGELRESRQVTYRGLTYEERLIQRDGGKVRIYLAVLQRVGVLASHAETIERVLDLHLAREASTASLSQLPAFQKSQSKVDTSAPLKLFINPRAWDAMLQRGMPADGEPLGRGQQLLLEAWRSLDFAAFSLRLEPQARLEGFLAFDSAAQAKELPEVLGSLTGSPSIFDYIPADCLAAAVGNIDVGRLVRWARKPADSPVVQAAPRKRSVPEVLFSMLDATFQGTGPSFGGFVAAAPQESEYPFAAAAGLEIGSRVAKGSDESAFKPLEALRSLLEAAVALKAGPDGTPPQVKLQKSADLEVLTVSNVPDVPGGIEPSFAFRKRVMLVGTSPSLLQQSATLAPEHSLAASNALRTLMGPRLVAPSQMAYVSLAGLRRLVAASPERVAAALSGKQEEKREETRRGLKELSGLLDLADVAAIAWQVEAGSVRISASVALDPPTN